MTNVPPTHAKMEESVNKVLQNFLVIVMELDILEPYATPRAFIDHVLISSRITHLWGKRIFGTYLFSYALLRKFFTNVLESFNVKTNTLQNAQSVWTISKFPFTWRNIRENNPIVYFSNKKVDFTKFSVIYTVWCYAMWKRRKFTLMRFWQKFRQNNGFTNRITK